MITQVQLNLMYREPLAPSAQPWDAHALLQPPAVGAWLESDEPFTTYLRPTAIPHACELAPIASLLAGIRLDLRTHVRIIRR